MSEERVVAPIRGLGDGVVIWGDITEDGFLSVNGPLRGPLMISTLLGLSFDIGGRLYVVKGG